MWQRMPSLVEALDRAEGRTLLLTEAPVETLRAKSTERNDGDVKQGVRRGKHRAYVWRNYGWRPA